MPRTSKDNIVHYKNVHSLLRDKSCRLKINVMTNIIIGLRYPDGEAQFTLTFAYLVNNRTLLSSLEQDKTSKQ